MAAMMSPVSDGAREVGSPAIRVVVQHPKLRRWELLQQCFSREDGFLVFPCEGPLDRLLLECQRLAPCVVLLEEKCLPRHYSSLSDSTMRLGPAVRVLVLGSQDHPDVSSLLSIGCWGFLRDSASPSELRSAVRALAGGEIWARRRTLSQLLQTSLIQLGPRALTRREMEILRLITQGLTNRQIAEGLCISHETVRWHIRSLYGKIGVQDRLGAVICGKQLLHTNRPPHSGDVLIPGMEVAPKTA